MKGVAAVVHSIQQNGWTPTQPLVVLQTGKNQYALLKGKHRLCALSILSTYAHHKEINYLNAHSLIKELGPGKFAAMMFALYETQKNATPMNLFDTVKILFTFSKQTVKSYRDGQKKIP